MQEVTPPAPQTNIAPSDGDEDFQFVESHTDTRAAAMRTGPLIFILPIGAVSIVKGLAWVIAFVIPEIYEYTLGIEVFVGTFAALAGAVVMGIAVLMARNTILKAELATGMMSIQRGIFTIDFNYVPMQQIVDINLKQDMLQQMFGLVSMSILTIRQERIIVRDLQNGLASSRTLMGLVQRSGGMLRSSSWIVQQ